MATLLKDSNRVTVTDGYCRGFFYSATAYRNMVPLFQCFFQKNRRFCLASIIILSTFTKNSWYLFFLQRYDSSLSEIEPLTPNSWDRSHFCTVPVYHSNCFFKRCIIP